MAFALAKVKGVHMATKTAREGNVLGEEAEEVFPANADSYFDFGEVRVSTVAMAGSILVVGATSGLGNVTTACCLPNC